MKILASALALAASVSGPTFATAQHTSPGSLLVLSKHDQTLAIVDPSTLTVISKVAVGKDPHEVTVSADGSKAYVSNHGFGVYHTLAVVDLLQSKPLPPIDLGALTGPHGLTFVGGKVWFTAEGAKAIGRYDPATQNIDWILGTGQNRTHMIYVAADGQHIITTNVSSGTISLIAPQPLRMPAPPGISAASDRDTRTDWNETVVKVGNGSEGFDVSPDGKEIWVANAQDGTISVLEQASGSVTQTLDANVLGANRLKFTLDGLHVLVSSLRSPDLVILDAHARKQIKRLPIGHGAAGIVIQPDDSRAFVACTPDNYVAVIDLRSLTVVGHVQAGDEPDGLAWAIRP
jgi:YVTN family beta-propeller protein